MADFKDRLGDYKDVPARVADFKEKHPEGTLRPLDPSNPYRVETIGSQTFIVFVAAAFRTPDDPAPGVGTAWEPFPGRTPYTKDSELQNAETSAWGRAIVAALASESKQIASHEDVRNRQADAVMAPKWVVRALVEKVKDEPYAQDLKARMADNDLSFTQPLTLEQFATVDGWVEELTSDDQPSSGSETTRSGGSRASQPPIPDSAPAAEISVNDNQGEATATNRAESQRETFAVVDGVSAEGGVLGEVGSPPADNLRSDLRERIDRLTDAQRLTLKTLWIAKRLPAVDDIDDENYADAAGLIGQAGAS